MIKKIMLIYIVFVISSCSSTSNFDRTKKIWDLYMTGNIEKPERKLTKEIVDSVGYPLIEIKTNNIIKRQLLLPISYRGNHINFFSGSGQSLTLTNFLISKTNGFNAYLISLETLDKKNFNSLDNSENSQDKYLKRYGFLNPLNDIENIDFLCKKIFSGETKVEIVESTYNVQVIKEDCISKKINFQNTYWIDSDGYIWKSNQWIAPGPIYAEIKVLKKF